MTSKRKYKKEKYKLNYKQINISRKILNNFLKKYNYNYNYLKKIYLNIIDNINYQFKINKQQEIYTLSKHNNWINNKKSFTKKKMNLKKVDFENQHITNDDNLIIDELLNSSKLKSELPILENY